MKFNCTRFWKVENEKAFLKILRAARKLLESNIWDLKEKNVWKLCMTMESLLSFSPRWMKINVFTNLSKPVETNDFFVNFCSRSPTHMSDLPSKSRDERTKIHQRNEKYFYVKSWRWMDVCRILLYSLFIAGVLAREQTWTFSDFYRAIERWSEWFFESPRSFFTRTSQKMNNRQKGRKPISFVRANSIKHQRTHRI